MKEIYVPSKYRKKESSENIQESDRKLLNIVKYYTGIYPEKIPERKRTKQTYEENLFIPEKWVR